jgi:SEC-C motif-containing protein
MKCPCGTELEFDACCGPIIAGERPAPTAEALMRSRYSAYAQKQVDYIVESHDPQTRGDLDENATADWADRTEWLKLEILNTEKGGESDDTGVVEFVARFRDERGKEHSHHERSTFVRRDGRWYYEDGDTPKSIPVTRGGPKVGRNDPCPCGSGKKFKKCCGAKAA